MKIGACYILFNEEDYIKESLESIYPFPDKIYIILGEPFNGSIVEKDSTEEIVRTFPDPYNKIVLIYSDETDESVNKNFQLDLCRKDGLDWMWIVDGDEVYFPDRLEIALNELDQVINLPINKTVDVIRVNAREYWRSIHYSPGTTEHYTFFSTNPNMEIRIRMPTKDFTYLSIKKDFILFNHYGLARTPNKMKEKYNITDNRLNTEMKKTYNLDKWLNEKFTPWRPDNQIDNIHPFRPELWNKVEKINNSEIPENMIKHKWYGIEVIE